MDRLQSKVKKKVDRQLQQFKQKHPEDKLIVVGSGILGMLKVWYAHKDAERQGRKLKVVMYDKGEENQSTSNKIVPSLTPDELISVVGSGSELKKASEIPFDQDGGIKVTDVNVSEDASFQAFLDAVTDFSADENGRKERTEKLLALGKFSMDLWQKFYDDADAELKAILTQSNFNPCREPESQEKRILHDGYRIDLIHNIPNAVQKAQGMVNDYAALGYQKCAILSPAEVLEIDPSLKDFCATNTENDQWKNGTTAIWRPGGCINAQTFLPLFREYLIKKMGTYAGSDGHEKNCFSIQYQTAVKGLYYNDEGDTITGLNLAGRQTVKRNKFKYEKTDYAFTTASGVDELGLAEATHTGFAGAVLILSIPLEPHEVDAWKDFNHCKEYHRPGVVLAWQGRLIKDAKGDHRLFLGVGGSKALYGNKIPQLNEAFAQNRHLMQLNAMNDVLPEVLSKALGRDTKGKILTSDDLNKLIEKGFAKPNLGVRAVAFDSCPSTGAVSHGEKRITNASCAMHASSGGWAFSHGLIYASNFATGQKNQGLTEQQQKVLENTVEITQSTRKPSRFRA